MEYENNIRGALTSRQNKILTLYLRGFGVEEIVKKLKIGRTTVYNELNKIRKVAKKEMRGYKESSGYLKNKAVTIERRLY